VEVFRYLAVNNQRVVSRRELEESIWEGIAVTDDSLSKCISEIRKVLGDDKRRQLKTFPKRGYQLIADIDYGLLQAVHEDTSNSNRIFLVVKRFIPVATVSVLLLVAVVALYSLREGEPIDLSNGSILPDGVPRLSVSATKGTSADDLAQLVVVELRASLSDYRTVSQTTENSDLQLTISHYTAGQTVVAELVDLSSGDILFAESYPTDASNDARALAIRIAAAVASPGVGVVDKYLIDASKLIPPEELSPAACYAHGFGCSKCSGVEDSITKRAEACLATLLAKNPQDSRAWALQATIFAHQYWWANTLPEPQRSDPKMRQHLPQKAIDAAQKAESLSLGGDTGVYWGMAEAYLSACDVDKLQSAIDRGLEINPNDPNLLGAFGNWLAYSGKWEEGAAMTLRGIEIEPVNYRKWWWMGPAKAAYVNGDFEQAYRYFLKSFDDRSWMSHLQQAYTLPFIGRVNEARKAAVTLQYIYPGFTREHALEIYDLYCFPDTFLQRMEEGLTLAGLPSRGSSDDLSNIQLPRAKVMHVNGVDLEYLDVGDGEPVLFIHGAFNDYRTWGHYMVPVSERHRYISYSRRYFGTQPWQDKGENYAVEVFAQDLIGLIEALELSSVHVVTWSSGVRTAIAAGAMRPDLFKSMVHFEPVEGNVMQGIPDEAHVKQLAEAWGVNYGPIAQSALAGDEDDAVRQFYELVFEAPPGSYDLERELLREVTRQNGHTIALNLSRYATDKIKLTCDYVSQVSVPTLVVHGSQTHELWQRMSRRFAECVPNGELVVIDGSNHYAPIEKIDEFADVFLQFVDSH